MKSAKQATTLAKVRRLRMPCGIEEPPGVAARPTNGGGNRVDVMRETLERDEAADQGLWTKYRYGDSNPGFLESGTYFRDTKFPAPQPAPGLSFRAMEQATADQLNAAKLSQGERR